MSQETVLSPSVLASIPDLLNEILIKSLSNKHKKANKTILISSNSLANRFIFERWGIRSSQQRRHKELFLKIREQCRAIFRHYERRGQFLSQVCLTSYRFGVFRFDEIRGNVILGFVSSDKNQYS